MTSQQDELLWLVRHRVRRRILIAVGDAGRISATALREKLGISTGSLYYNLRQLAPLIKQDQKRNYMLTAEGERIYKLVTQQVDELPSPKTKSRVAAALENILFPIWLFSPLYEYPKMAAVMAPLSLAILAFLFINSRQELIMLHAIKPERFALTDFGLKTLFTIVVAFVYLSVISAVISGNIRLPKVNSLNHFVAENLKFLACIVVSFLPMGLFPGLYAVDRVFNLGIFAGNYGIFARDTVLIISQTITVLMLTAAVAYSKKMRWQLALAVAFSYFYLSYGASYFIR